MAFVFLAVFYLYEHVDVIGDPRSLVEAKKEWDLSRKKRDQISAKLGERMLEGWALLGDECPNETCLRTTLMRKKLGYGQRLTLFVNII
jgi:hypothetical protein